MISLEEIVALVIKEVVLELSKKGIHIDSEISNVTNFGASKRKIKMDMKKYKTPLLTEASILELGLEIEEIEVPEKTIITPSAFDLIRERKIIIKKIK